MNKVRELSDYRELYNYIQNQTNITFDKCITMQVFVELMLIS